MKRFWKSLVVASAIAALGLAFGFVAFATHVMRDTPDKNAMADGIVVLTGPGNRISAGAALLSAGRAKRMLITGVNRRTPAADVARISGLDRQTFTCCVDLGYEALNTIGNADETRNWAKAHNFKRLLIVTSSYHMPRSLAEMSLTLPEAILIPHSVMPSAFPDAGWWLNWETVRTLVSEYLKFLPAAARVAIHRAVAIASAGAAEPAQNEGHG